MTDREVDQLLADLAKDDYEARTGGDWDALEGWRQALLIKAVWRDL